MGSTRERVIGGKTQRYIKGRMEKKLFARSRYQDEQSLVT